MMERSGLPLVHGSELYRWSTNYQWLPGEVTFNNTSPTSVNITSCINNLHLTTQSPLYNLIEKFISLSIEPWNSVLMKGEHGRAPIRIRTYDTVDEAEVLAIAAAERAEYKDRSEPFDSPTVFPPCNHNPQHPGPGTAST